LLDHVRGGEGRFAQLQQTQRTDQLRAPLHGHIAECVERALGLLQRLFEDAVIAGDADE
jgi:hypothetical protein